MSTSLSRRPAAHPTRQQLDDLDALLKRMLDLPVNRLDDEPPEDASPTPTPEPSQAEAPAEVSYCADAAEEADLKPRVVAETPEAAAQPPEDRPDDWVPLSAAWRPSARTWKPLTEAWEQAQAAAALSPEAAPQAEQPAPVPEEPDEAPAAVTEPMPEEPSAVAPAPEPEPEPTPAVPPVEQRRTRPSLPELPPSWLMWPVIGVNALCDAGLARCGAPGRWLGGRLGRNLLGAVGLLCLLAALALCFADWIGWTW